MAVQMPITKWGGWELVRRGSLGNFGVFIERRWRGGAGGAPLADALSQRHFDHAISPIHAPPKYPSTLPVTNARQHSRFLQHLFRTNVPQACYDPMRTAIPLLLILAAGLWLACSEAPAPSAPTTDTAMETTALKSFHDFSVTDIDGNAFDLSSLKGKKVLVVNTASECGLTPQYAQLQELFETKGGDSFTIVGFPANNFGGQEPGTDAQIQTFCSKNYGVTFPMMSKISVKGDDIHPLYAWLTSKAENGVEDSKVKWNFHKYLIDENGALVKNVGPTTSPIDAAILDWIQS